MQPFADKFRPQTIDEMVGQNHILGPGKIMRKFISQKAIPNMILYGPPGTGKTTLAYILAKELGMDYQALNAIDIGVGEIRDAIKKADKEKGLILYIDEFHMLNKKQQQTLLAVIEKGAVTLIASTAENPYFSIYKAIVSRSLVIEFKPINVDEIKLGVEKNLSKIKEMYHLDSLTMDDKALTYLAESAGGDMRTALNKLEVIFLQLLSSSKDMKITTSDIEAFSLVKAELYDTDGDSHYNLLSAFHKSLRGSDPNASIYYLAKLLKGGDLQSVCRRLLCVASEDVGLANPQAAVIVKACTDNALQLGLPEARLPLSQATLFLALQPKSNSVLCIDEAMSLIEREDCGDIPAHLKDSHYSGAKKLGHGVEYKYPHLFSKHWVAQQYLPDNIKGVSFYKPQDSKIESSYNDYWKNVKGEL